MEAARGGGRTENGEARRQKGQDVDGDDGRSRRRRRWQRRSTTGGGVGGVSVGRQGRWAWGFSNPAGGWQAMAVQQGQRDPRPGGRVDEALVQLDTFTARATCEPPEC